MRTFTSVMPKDAREAATLAQRARAGGQVVAFAGGGSDVLGQIKERVVSPDILIYLKSIKGLDTIVAERKEDTNLVIGGLTTLDALGENELVRRQYAAIAEAAETVATPQIRNVATVAGNLCQRPWCWYYRNGFNCFKNGGTTCYSVGGENEFHAILGGGPSFIVHPSDLAPPLVAFEARFRIVGPGGERIVPAGEFFTLPKDNAARENVLGEDEVLASVMLPRAPAGTRSTYFKVMDREAWTHAVVSAAVVLQFGNGVCSKARIVLGGVAPVPWRVPEAEQLLTGQRITPELAVKVAEASVAGARPLAKNGYKITMTRAMVRRVVESFVV